MGRRVPQGYAGEFLKWRGRHMLEPMLVCGLGPSIEGFVPPEGVITIGVNDCGPGCTYRNITFTPDYLVILDPPANFEKGRGRMEAIQSTKCKAVFIRPKIAPAWRKRLTQYIVEMPIRQCAAHTAFWEWVDPHTGYPEIHHRGKGSPFAAISLAGYLGALRIGVIGADYVDHPSFKDDLHKVPMAFEVLKELLDKLKIQVRSLSETSVLNEVFGRVGPTWLTRQGS